MKQVRASLESVKRKIADDYRSIIERERQNRSDLGLPTIASDDELAADWIEYLFAQRRPELARVTRESHRLLFPKEPCPICHDRTWIDDPNGRDLPMVSCPCTERKLP